MLRMDRNSTIDEINERVEKVLNDVKKNIYLKLFYF